MAKTTGLGDNFYIGGFDLSGDVGSLSTVHGGPAALDVTPINASAFVRLGGLRDGSIEFSTFFENTTSGQGFEHNALAPLPTADVIASYFQGTAVGNAAAGQVSKQVNYDWTRGQDGSLTASVQCVSNAFGLEWGTQLTAGLRSDTTATTGAFFDWGASSAFGAQAYFQLVSFTGTSVTIDVQAATTSGGTYTTTGLTTTAMTAVGAQRLATSNAATINEFTKVVTTGTFTNAVFAVMVVRNALAAQVF